MEITCGVELEFLVALNVSNANLSSISKVIQVSNVTRPIADHLKRSNSCY